MEEANYMSRRNMGRDFSFSEGELANLAELSIAELRERWRTQLRSQPPPVQSADVVAAMLAWALQAKASAGLDRWTERRLSEIAEVLDRRGRYEPRGARRMNVGAVLTREWKGVLHRVTVEADGFHHEGKCYGSLSDVARGITGTRWSGPRFFGLELRKPKKPKRAVDEVQVLAGDVSR